MTRAAWRKMLLAEQGPVSQFVRGMRGFELVPWVPGSGVCCEIAARRLEQGVLPLAACST